MKKILISTSLLVANFALSQTNSELKTEIEKIKTEIVDLKNEIQSVKSQNIYLKEKLNINTPILQQTKDNTSFKITKVLGNKKLKTVTISFLVETIDQNKNPLLDNFSAIDLEGNKFVVERFKEIIGMSGGSISLTHKIPLKITFAFIEVPETTKVLKLVKFHYFSGESMKHEDIEFRDLNITWE